MGMGQVVPLEWMDTGRKGCLCSQEGPSWSCICLISALRHHLAFSQDQLPSFFTHWRPALPEASTVLAAQEPDLSMVLTSSSAIL